jgi:hypothetical protein
VQSKLVEEIQKLGGDVGDLVWQWFAGNGPHGPSFTWRQTRRQPPGYVGVEHLERIIAENEEHAPGFRTRANSVVRKALLSNDVNLLRRAIQVAAVVGDQTDLQRISALTQHENERVAADARASKFYLRKRLDVQRS